MLASLQHFLTVFWETKSQFLVAAQLTLAISAVAIVLGVLLGLVLAMAREAKLPLLKPLYQAYVYLIRGTPLIVQIFVLYFGLTEIVQISAFWSAGIALAVHNGAYIAEVFRGAIQSVARGQVEASLALGLSSRQTFRWIVLPQALLRALPSLGTQFIIAVKDSSLAAFISMSELFNIATSLGAANFDQMTYLLVVSVYYLALVALLSLAVGLLERQLGFVHD